MKFHRVFLCRRNERSIKVLEKVDDYQTIIFQKEKIIKKEDEAQRGRGREKRMK